MNGYLIYRPKRDLSTFSEMKVYHDRIKRGNQDPYVWNKQFLHTYCHITQIRFTKGNINFWVSGDTFPDFSHLYCDLVFVVQDICPWKEQNHIDRTDPMVDSIEAFIDHFQWAECGEHRFKRRRRFMLKADPDRSFQSQDANGGLIDIVPFLIKAVLPLDKLRQELRAQPTSNRGAEPYVLKESIAIVLYEWLEQQASIKLTGKVLVLIRRNNPQLASSPRKKELADRFSLHASG